MNRTKCKVAGELRAVTIFAIALIFSRLVKYVASTVLTDNKNGDFHKTYKTFIRVVRPLRSVVGFTASFYVYRAESAPNDSVYCSIHVRRVLNSKPRSEKQFKFVAVSFFFFSVHLND